MKNKIKIIFCLFLFIFILICLNCNVKAYTFTANNGNTYIVEDIPNEYVSQYNLSFENPYLITYNSPVYYAFYFTVSPDCYFVEKTDYGTYIRGGAYILTYSSSGYKLQDFSHLSITQNLSLSVDIQKSNVSYFSNSDIYTDFDKQEVYYKANFTNGVTPGGSSSGGTSSYDFSSTGILKWIADYFERMTGMTIEQGMATEEYQNYMKEVERINQENDKNIFEKIADILSYVNPFSENFFAYKLLELLGDLLKGLFVPSEERLQAIPDTINEKFAFITSIKEGSQGLSNFINNIDDQPKLSYSVDSKYYKGEVMAIDLSWYADFKPFVDLVITGFVYLFFLWRLIVHAPNIIGGISSNIDFINSNRKGG